MIFTLDRVVPWGRSYDEYISMFSLSDEDLGKRILGCSDVTASFNAELTSRGGRVVSVDPIYQFSPKEIQARIDEIAETVLSETRKNSQEFVWSSIKDIEELGNIRMDAMSRFLEDFSKGKSEGRYVVGVLPVLEFHDNEFHLALCSHFLFLYSEHNSLEFHIQSLIELCRVAGDVRVFPVLELGSEKSRHLGEVVEYLSEKGYECSIEKVAYEFQKGGNKMLRVKSSNTYEAPDCQQA